MQIKKHIPNLITCGNLICGSLAIINLFETQANNWYISSILIIVAAILDFFDGFAARLLKVQGELGKQLDSLADMVTFGLAPSLLVYQNLKFISDNPYLPYTALLIAALSLFRLAKFNIDTRQTNSFIGLPTPANALFWISFPLISHFQPDSFLLNYINTTSIVILTVIFSFLLVSELPLFSLKLKGFKFHDNKIPYLFILSSGILLVLSGYTAIPFTIIIYIVLSIIITIVKSDKEPNT